MDDATKEIDALADENANLRAELRRARETIWCLAHEAGGSITISIATLLQIHDGCRVSVEPSADGLTQVIWVRGV